MTGLARGIPLAPGFAFGAGNHAACSLSLCRLKRRLALAADGPVRRGPNRGRPAHRNSGHGFPVPPAAGTDCGGSCAAFRDCETITPPRLGHSALPWLKPGLRPSARHPPPSRGLRIFRRCPHPRAVAENQRAPPHLISIRRARLPLVHNRGGTKAAGAGISAISRPFPRHR
jgi:hypothetical protein